jgi:hypothetical protein
MGEIVMTYHSSRFVLSTFLDISIADSSKLLLISLLPFILTTISLFLKHLCLKLFALFMYHSSPEPVFENVYGAHPGLLKRFTNTGSAARKEAMI